MLCEIYFDQKGSLIELRIGQMTEKFPMSIAARKQYSREGAILKVNSLASF